MPEDRITRFDRSREQTEFFILAISIKLVYLTFFINAYLENPAKLNRENLNFPGMVRVSAVIQVVLLSRSLVTLKE